MGDRQHAGHLHVLHFAATKSKSRSAAPFCNTTPFEGVSTIKIYIVLKFFFNGDYQRMGLVSCQPQGPEIEKVGDGDR